jgi:hypothetical protein
MSWPDYEILKKQREAFDANGGPDRVSRQIEGLDAITKHPQTREPWPAFHRCHVCGEHPEVMGTRCLKVGRYGEHHFCEYCVSKMFESLKT